MSICSVCNKKVLNFNMRIIRGANKEWVCRECLKKANIGILKFSFVRIPSSFIKTFIEIGNRNTIYDFDTAESKFNDYPQECEYSNSPTPPVPALSDFNEILIPPRQEPQPRFLSACRKVHCTNEYEAYFKNGELYDVNPRNHYISLDDDRQTAYSARYIISDGIKYDLENPDSISKIKIPDYKVIAGLPYITRDMSNIIKMRAGGEHRPPLAVPLVFKAVNLMLACPISYTKDDYYRMVKQLWLIGEIKYGDYLLEELKNRLPFLTDDRYYHTQAFIRELDYANKVGLDHLSAGHSSCLCGKCVQFQDRIYSISGKDPRFPKLPKFIIEQKGLHCDLTFSACLPYEGETITKYIGSENEFTTIEVDAIKYSNRPFIDDRNEFEKQRYINMTMQLEKMRRSKELSYNRDYWIYEYRKHLEYQKIVDIMGEKAPKSYGGYIRMKRNNTVNYQKIVAILKEYNIDII